MEYYEIKQFLSALEYPYYVYGGNALKQLVKDIYSNDWDITIDAPKNYINKMRKILENIIKVPVSIMKQQFIIERTGYSAILYTLRSNEDDLIDVRFNSVNMSNLIRIDGIYYLDLPKIYKNLQESIYDNEYIIDQLNSIFNLTVENIINKELENIDDDRLDPDPEIREEYKEMYLEIISEKHYKEIEKEIKNMINKGIPEYNKALKLISKNTKRMKKIEQAIKNPSKFRLEYILELCEKCEYNNGLIAKEISDYRIKCSEICEDYWEL